MSYVFKQGTVAFGSAGYVFGVKEKEIYVLGPLMTDLGKSPVGISIDPNSANDRYLIGYTDGSIDVYSLNSNNKIATYTGFGGPVISIAFDPIIANNRLFIVVNNSVKIVSGIDFSIVRTVTITGNPYNIEFNPFNANEIYIADSSAPGGIFVYNIETFIVGRSYSFETYGYLSSAICPVVALDKMVVTISPYSRVVIASYSTGAAISNSGIYGVLSPSGVAFSSDGSLYVVAANGAILVYLATNNNVSVIRQKIGHTYTVKKIVCDKTNRFLITANDNNGTVLELKKITF